MSGHTFNRGMVLVRTGCKYSPFYLIYPSKNEADITACSKNIPLQRCYFQSRLN